MDKRRRLDENTYLETPPQSLAKQGMEVTKLAGHRKGAKNLRLPVASEGDHRPHPWLPPFTAASSPSSKALTATA